MPIDSQPFRAEAIRRAALVLAQRADKQGPERCLFFGQVLTSTLLAVSGKAHSTLLTLP